LKFGKHNKRKLNRLVDRIRKGYIERSGFSVSEIVYQPEEIVLHDDFLNFPLRSPDGSLTQHGERVLEKYAAFLKVECKKAGEDEWRFAPYHSQQPEAQTKGLRRFLEDRKQGSPQKDYIDQLYQEIATLLLRDGVPRAEVIQRIKNSNHKRINPSGDVTRALDRYPDNETLEHAEKHQFSFLEIQQLEESQ